MNWHISCVNSYMKLYIISNRLPVKVTKEDETFVFSRSEGGLATGLDSLQISYEKHWIGWPGICVDNEESKEEITFRLEGINFHPVFLSEIQIKNYYEGYSNSTIWPLCHYFFVYTLYRNSFWQSYQEVNQLFCDAICRVIRPGDKVWIQDYQLMLLPGMLRKVYPDLNIGYFHHIPFPSYELFRILPERAEILKGLLGADFIAFHTHDYMRHFISAVERVLRIDFKLDEAQLGNRVVETDALPMGINYGLYHNASSRPEVRRAIDRTRKFFGNHKLILSVDRLDYSKGILHRLFLSFLIPLNDDIPYSAYGRIANNLFQPIWQWGNNLLAYLAERADSYAFYETDVWLKSLPTFIIAAATLAVLVVLAGRNGRTYCNTICPVGTVLGFLSRYSLFRITIDSEKCNQCSLCSRNCKAACINFKEHQIDASRCVVCMNCIEKCKHGAISYKYHPFGKPAAGKADSEQINETRRSFFTATALVAATSVLKAQEKKVDGGLAAIEDKKIPERSTPLTPPGSLSARNMAQHCTACQLCVSACPNQVLRPSADLRKLMQPEMSYERGYCRPECTKCSEVCPAGAIRPITKADKSSIQIGHAVWVKKNCIPLTDGVQCGNCARHCPTGAIQMVPSIPEDKDSPKIPVINVERCIGCGACENLCPARPFSAIYVEGHERHRII